MPEFRPGDLVRLRLDVVKRPPKAAGLRITLVAGSAFVVVRPAEPWGDVSAGWQCVEANEHGAPHPDGRGFILLACHLELVKRAAIAEEPQRPAEPEGKGGTLFDC